MKEKSLSLLQKVSDFASAGFKYLKYLGSLLGRSPFPPPVVNRKNKPGGVRPAQNESLQITSVLNDKKGITTEDLNKIAEGLAAEDGSIITLDFDETLTSSRHFFGELAGSSGSKFGKLSTGLSAGFTTLSALVDIYKETYGRGDDGVQSDLRVIRARVEQALNVSPELPAELKRQIQLLLDLDVLPALGQNKYEARLDLLCGELLEPKNIPTGKEQAKQSRAELANKFFGIQKYDQNGEVVGYDKVASWASSRRMKAITNIFDSASSLDDQKSVLVAVASHGITPQAIQALLYQVFINSGKDPAAAMKILDDKHTLINDSTVIMNMPGKSKQYHFRKSVEKFKSLFKKDPIKLTHYDDSRNVCNNTNTLTENPNQLFTNSANPPRGTIEQKLRTIVEKVDKQRLIGKAQNLMTRYKALSGNHEDETLEKLILNDRFHDFCGGKLSEQGGVFRVDGDEYVYPLNKGILKEMESDLKACESKFAPAPHPHTAVQAVSGIQDRANERNGATPMVSQNVKPDANDAPPPVPPRSWGGS